MESILALFSKYKVELDDISEELVYRSRMSVPSNNISDTGLKHEIAKECRERCEKYHSSELITDLENSILADIEMSIEDGQLTSEERKDYLTIEAIIFQRYIKHLNEFECQAKRLSRNGYNDYNAYLNHSGDKVPVKIKEVHTFIEDCKNNLSTERYQIIEQINKIDVKNNDDLLKRYSA